LLEGKLVNLRIVEKEDLPLAAEWTNNPDFMGEYNPLIQVSREDIQKSMKTLLMKEDIFS